MRNLITIATALTLLGVPAPAQNSGGLVLPGTDDGTTTTAPAPAPTPVPAPPTAEDPSVEIVFWDSIKDSDNPDLFLDYLQRYPNGVFSVIAEAKLKEIYGDGSDTGAGMGNDTGVQQTNNGTQTQNAGGGQDQPGNAFRTYTGGRFGHGFIGFPPIDRMTNDDHNWTRRQITMGLQRQLRRVGCYYGAIDGVWGPQSRAAVARYNRATGNNFHTNGPNVNTWRHVYQTAKGRICR